MNAALTLIDRQGVRTVSMEAIAELAGVTKVTLYRRWSSRAALLADVLLHRIQDELPLDAHGDPLTEIDTHARTFVATLAGPTSDLLREVIAEDLGSIEMITAFREHYLGQRRALAITLIQRGQASGVFTAQGRPETLHDALYGAIFYRFLFGFGGLEAADAQALVDTVLRPARTHTPETR